MEGATTFLESAAKSDPSLVVGGADHERLTYQFHGPRDRVTR